MNPDRRTVLKAGLAASSLFLPLPYAWVWAQSEGAHQLLRAPKIALVIGNSAYRHTTTLNNPANDAKAIASLLKSFGFDVTMKLDASRAELATAIQAHVRKLAENKGIGLFYFAGHGLQLAWRNYLVPVEAAIKKETDVPQQCMEIGNLIDGLNAAANPMNIIILDACRQNPFGNDFRDTHKGLSQMDAPPSTLLAYATAPGNVASDGEGANGLYTEHLLKEMQVRESRLEDIFKRVRLEVRRKTQGAQMPWESTSLEEDFYFLPPPHLKARSDAEREKEFQEQFAAWEKIKASPEPAALTAFLLRYPSGHFSELAQQRLDHLLATQGEKRIQLPSSRDNPFSKGSATLDTRYRVGDSYSYRVLDPGSGGVTRQYTNAITEINAAQVIFDNGLVTDLLGNTLKMHDGRVFTDNQNIPVEFAVGKQWTTRYQVSRPNGQNQDVEMNYVIVSRAPLTVPAGTFDAFLIEGTGFTWSKGGKVEIIIRVWWDPQRVRRPIAREEFRQVRLEGGGGWQERRRFRPNLQGKVRVLISERHELTAYHQS
ncbi:MAG: caspase domain protein [Proteobacteria bacterium]|nr:caspase domain protein [Pseudomonadota bacterium]